MRQTWADIAFLHWAVEPAVVERFMPPGVRPDVLDGATYVGLIPFRMQDAGFGRGPAVPWLGTFLETNVRLYSVDDAGRHGVVFLSLESARVVVSALARLVFGTPYTWARMDASVEAGVHRYRTSRRWPGPRGAGGRIEVRPGGPVAEPTELEHFVTARFGLHTRVLGRTWWVPNTHRAWPLHRAELVHLDDTLLEAAGFPGLATTAPTSVLWSPGTFTTFGFPRAGVPRTAAARG
jgi:uncharacterized protein YqjF (DUF2071 family)